jgi:hypothetical protein
VNRNSRRKRNFFELGSGALTALGLEGKHYACPICAEIFDETALTNSTLTLEDVPPKSVGGKPMLLTCASCNNTAGYRYEHHLKLREETLEQAKGLIGQSSKSLGHFKQKFGDTEVNVDIERSGETFNIKISEKNDPSVIAATHRFLCSFEEGSEFQLSTGKSYIPNLAALADQKTAFLIIGLKFGYTYFLNERTKLVRGQLKSGVDKGEEPLLKYISDEPTLGNNIAINEKKGLAFLELNSRIVAMPWISLPEAGFHDRLLNSMGSDNSCQVFPWPEQFEAVLDFKNIVQE